MALYLHSILKYYDFFNNLQGDGIPGSMCTRVSNEFPGGGGVFKVKRLGFIKTIVLNPLDLRLLYCALVKKIVEFG